MVSCTQLPKLASGQLHRFGKRAVTTCCMPPFTNVATDELPPVAADATWAVFAVLGTSLMDLWDGNDEVQDWVDASAELDDTRSSVWVPKWTAWPPPPPNGYTPRLYSV